MQIAASMVFITGSIGATNTMAAINQWICMRFNISLVVTSCEIDGCYQRLRFFCEIVMKKCWYLASVSMNHWIVGYVEFIYLLNFPINFIIFLVHFYHFLQYQKMAKVAENAIKWQIYVIIWEKAQYTTVGWQKNN